MVGSSEIGRRAWWAWVVVSLAVALSSTAAIVAMAVTDSFWIDELTSYWFSRAPRVASVLERMLYREDPHPPGYQLALQAWFRFGTTHTAAAARASSLVCVLVAAACLFQLLRRLDRNGVGQFLAPVLYLCTASTLQYGAELRSYAFQQALLALFLVARAGWCEPGMSCSWQRRIAGLSALGVLAVSHYGGALLAGAFFVCDVWATRSTWTSLRDFVRVTVRHVAYLVGPVLAACWLLYARRFGGMNRTLREQSLGDLAEYPVAAFGPWTLGILALVMFALVTGIGSRQALQRMSDDEDLWRGLSAVGLRAVILAFGLMVAISVFKPIVQARNFVLYIPSLTAACALFLACIARATTYGRWLLWFASLCWGAASAWSVWSTLGDTSRMGEDWFSMVRQIGCKDVLVMTDDIAQKVRDARRLTGVSCQGPQAAPMFLESREEGQPVGRSLRDVQQAFLACPHCSGLHRKRLLREGRRFGFQCHAQESASGDKLYLCTRRRPIDR